MAEPAVLAITNQQERLVIADVKRKPVAAIQLAVATAHFRVTRFIVSILVEAKDAGITIAIGNKDGPIRGGTAAVIRHSLGDLKPASGGAVIFSRTVPSAFIFKKSQFSRGVPFCTVTYRNSSPPSVAKTREWISGYAVAIFLSRRPSEPKTRTPVLLWVLTY